MMPSSVNTPTKEASSVFQNSGIGKYRNTVIALSISEANRAGKLELGERHEIKGRGVTLLARLSLFR